MQPALTQLQHPVGLLRERRIVGHDEQRRRARAGQRQQQRQHLARALLVEIAGGLVRQQQARLVHQRARDGDALLFASGEILHGARGTRGEADRRERRKAARARRRAAHAVELEHQAHVLCHVERRDEVEELVDEADMRAAKQRARGLAERAHLQAVDVHAAAVGAVDAADEVEQRRLARAAAPHDGQRLPGTDLRLHPGEHTMHLAALGEAAGQLPDGEHGATL